VTNEILKSVLFEFVGTDRAGKEMIFETVRLTNATVADLKRTVDEHTPEGARGIDQVALVFQKIEVTDTVSKTTASDDWQLSGG